MIAEEKAIAHNLRMRPIQKVSPQKWRALADEVHAAKLPLVIQGLFLSQAESWSPGRFAREWGDHEIGVVVNLPKHGVPYREKSEDYQKTMKLGEFVSMLYNGEPCYLNQAPIKDFPELRDELDVHSLNLGDVFAVNLWFGSNTRSGLHFDNADNLFGQVYGTKEAFLVSPDYSKFLYPFSNNPSKSQVDLEIPDFNKYPKLKQVETWYCELQAGDGLYMPRGWWHHIMANDISISVNCWHGRSLTELEYTRLCLAGGGPVLWRTVRDFVWHGIFKRPYQYRLFSPPPLGIAMYNKLKVKKR